MISCKSNGRWRMIHSVVLEGFIPQQNYKSLPAMVLCLIHKYRSIMNTKFINFKVQPFAFTYLLRWWIEQVFVTVATESKKSPWNLLYFFERELRTKLPYTVYSPTELNQSFLMKRIYDCNTILLWWGLGVDATANMGRKSGLLLSKASEINWEWSQRKILPRMICCLLYSCLLLFQDVVLLLLRVSSNLINRGFSRECGCAFYLWNYSLYL